MKDAVRVRPAERSDAAAWLPMRRALWPEGSVEEHAIEIEPFLSGRAREPLAVLIGEDAAGEPLGFAELSVRAYAEDCSTDAVLDNAVSIAAHKALGFADAGRLQYLP